jgi:[protein-PII] uridylyltransferase
VSRLARPPDAERWWPADGSGAEPAGLRAAIEGADRALAAAFAAGEPIARLVAVRAWAIEQGVLAAWAVEFGSDAQPALFAVGGFGRGELHPRSDVDLLIVVPSGRSDAVARAVERFLGRLWDAGLQVGHAVRTVAECGEAGRADITIATNLFEARWIAGSEAAARDLADELAAPDFWPADRYAAAKVAEQAARHARFNDTAHNLEPNIKEGPGGLRDLATILWIGGRRFGRPTLDALAEGGLILPTEHAQLVAARDTLWRVRFALHAGSRRPEERLLFEHQRRLAEAFGHVDPDGGNAGVERFMQSVFRAAMTIDRLNERILRRFAERDAAFETRPVGADFVRCGDCLGLAPGRDLVARPDLLIEAFRRPLDDPSIRGFGSALLTAIDEALPRLGERLLAAPGVREAFLAILDHPGPVDEALARMARCGVLGRLLPAFGSVAGHMQFDLFHVYTVDQHTLFVIRNLRAFARPEAAQAFPLAHALYHRLRRPALLVLAGLFHDIAKGRGGDHSELGAEEALSFAAELGLAPSEGELVAWLVRNHLLMSLTAQKQDIGDPAVVRRFAEACGDDERLDHLYCLTVADIRATSPKLWNSWRDRLLMELHQAARDALARGLAHPAGASERVRDARAAALALVGEGRERVEALWEEFPDDSFLRYTPEQLAWQTRSILRHADPGAPLVVVRDARERGSTEVFVYASDRPGVFATITAVLDRLDLSVLEARVVTSRCGHTLDTFQVLGADGAPVTDPARRGQIALRLRDELGREELTAKPARRVASRRQRQFHVPTRIDFEPAESGRTRLALVCADRPGLLAHVAAALRESGVQVHDARIATFGERAEDYFELTGGAGALDEAETARVRESLLAHLDADAPAAVAQSV